jgi:hypothetical protein
MTAPYTPTPFAAPIVNPAVGSTGAPPIPYLSNTQYNFAPTAMDTSTLVPGGSPQAQAQSLADTIRRASRWADSICFGADPASKGVSLAASLSVESVRTRIKAGELRLICDYRPILEVVGIDVGFDPSNTSSIGPTLAAQTVVKRRTLVVPFATNLVFGRTNDNPGWVPNGAPSGSLYAVWSYVSGYPHTSLVDSVAADATSCVVKSTDGNGGAWGVYPASGAFPGTGLTIIDGASTETVFVTAVTTGSGTTTLTTTPFANAHTVPTAPDFIPVTTLPEDVQQAVISLTTMLIKTRGTRALVMPTAPGGRPQQATKQNLGQAGALEDYDIAHQLLSEGGYVIRSKQKT